mgnify:CR=1 FL=1
MRARRGRKIRGLIVRWPYVEMLAEGTKKWEIRKANTKFRGVVAFLSRGWLYGFAELTDSFEMSVTELRRYGRLHRANDVLEEYASDRDTLYVWVFRRPLKLPRPVKVTYARGARIWVQLEERKVLKALKERKYYKELQTLLDMLRRSGYNHRK